MALCYHLYAHHHWPLRDIRELMEGADGWAQLIRGFAAFEADQAAER